MDSMLLEGMESVWEMQEIVSALRLQAEENQRDLDSRCYQRSYTRIYQTTETITEENGNFFLRTAVSLLIFCGFLWLQRENRSVLGVAPEAVQEVISQNVVLQEKTDSVTMDTVTDELN